MKRGGGAKVSFYSDGNLESAFRNFFNQVIDEYEDSLAIRLKTLNELILSETPVWSGDMIHNWRWSTKAPNFDHQDPIEVPDDTGYTSTMPLGDEPRRRANASRPRQSLAGALRARKPVDIYLTNTSEHAVEVEAGIAFPGFQSRAHAGFLRLAIKQVFG